MKIIRSFLMAFLAATILSSANADDSIDTFTKRIRTAVQDKDKSALLACFNLHGINEEERAAIEKIADDIVGWSKATVEITPFQTGKQREWDQAKPNLNGRPSVDISFSTETNATPKMYSMVAGTSLGGFSILLTNRKPKSEQQERSK